ncbi:MAG: EamA family transporter [Rhizobiales bacterium]|nr:EamA family transporter [Hyphomicrobiales bacterium]OJX98719.1 MAG: hypothetical protein BGP07_13355 [Rhizobiales bacterium 63-22]
MCARPLQVAEDRNKKAAPPTVRRPSGLPLQLFLYTLMFSIWGSSFFFTALALRSFNGFTVPILRMVLATLALGAIVAFRRLPLPRDPVLWMHLALLGALNIAIPYILLTLAQLHVHSSLTSVLSATTPLFAFLFSWLLVRTERFNAIRALGLLVAFGGIAALYGFGQRTGGGFDYWELIIVFSSAMFAGGNVYTRRFLNGIHPFVVAFLQIGLGALYLLVAGLASGTFQIGAPSPISVLAILELGFAGSALTYLLFFHFIHLWGSTAASLNTYFQPLVGVTLGVLVLGDRVSPSGWLSLATVLCGVIIFGAGSLRSLLRKPAATVVPCDCSIPNRSFCGDRK